MFASLSGRFFEFNLFLRTNNRSKIMPTINKTSQDGTPIQKPSQTSNNTAHQTSTQAIASPVSRPENRTRQFESLDTNDQFVRTSNEQRHTPSEGRGKYHPLQAISKMPKSNEVKPQKPSNPSSERTRAQNLYQVFQHAERTRAQNLYQVFQHAERTRHQNLYQVFQNDNFLDEEQDAQSIATDKAGNLSGAPLEESIT
jgi:hypothetical protein